MSTLILSNQDCCFGGYKVQSYINQMAMDQSADALDQTTFGSNGNREFIGGLKALGFSMSGFYQGAPVDGALMDSRAVANTVVQVGPQNGSAGSPAAFFKAVATDYNIGGSVGDLLGFTLNAQNSDPAGLVRGTIMVNSTTINSNSTSTGRQLGAITATQKLYAALNVFTAAGTTPGLVVTIESDDNSGFTTPTTRATFTSFNAIGAEWKEVAGAVTDTYWRAKWVVSGTGPVFGAMISFGIK